MLGSKAFQNSWAKLLASLFFLLTASQLCIAAPYSDQLAVRDDQRIYSRALTPELADYKRKIEAADADKTIVGTSETKFFDFTPAGNHLTGSSSFAGCFGVIIATKQGAIIGHYNLDQAGLDKAKDEIPALYKEHNDLVGGGAPHLYSAVEYETGELVEPNLFNEYKRFLNELVGTDPAEHTYTEVGEIIVNEDLEEWDDDFVSGGFVVENAGGGKADTRLFFINIEHMKGSLRPGQGN
ncbi:hypothetical protein FBEOM_8021 [Fusarium beomiforme]|uniref:Uncharacterized protein n=1 Tax=Fusarium beomiforme TaxID=44412 RepID=A0A9P5AHN2_9HYPO|nr:hypothetical protein FBEOM_8021 [Fusarium beomiforme]